jgi:hypothetical protein
MDRRFATDGVLFTWRCVVNDAKIEQLKIKRDAAMQVAVEVVDTTLRNADCVSPWRYDYIRFAIDGAKAAKENYEQALKDAEAEWNARNREFNHEDMQTEARIAERVGL